jgi:hypothetical protein
MQGGKAHISNLRLKLFDGRAAIIPDLHFTEPSPIFPLELDQRERTTLSTPGVVGRMLSIKDQFWLGKIYPRPLNSSDQRPDQEHIVQGY